MGKTRAMGVRTSILVRGTGGDGSVVREIVPESQDRPKETECGQKPNRTLDSDGRGGRVWDPELRLRERRRERERLSQLCVYREEGRTENDAGTNERGGVGRGARGPREGQRVRFP